MKQKVISPLRPPAVPLVTHDPYFSVWSFGDKLTDDWAKHWTGSVQAFVGMIRIDGKAYRWAGTNPQAKEAMAQVSVTVTATRTVYVFEKDGVNLTVTFLSPLIADDLNLLSRPVTYLSLEAKSTDGKPHEVSLYVDVTGEWVVNKTDQAIVWSRYQLDGLQVLRLGTQDQPVLKTVGDDRRIDWGHLYVAASNGTSLLASDSEARGSFVTTGTLATHDDLRMPRAASDAWPVAAFVFALGSVSATPVRRTVLLAYDEMDAIEYFQRPLKAYWQRTGATIGDALIEAAAGQKNIEARCAAFDQKLQAEAVATGGEGYASLCALAYRQAITAHKLVSDIDGTPLFFSKENFSNGCIATVDVTYPSAPLFLWLNPTLLKAMVTPLLDYAASPRWKFPFAPHDLGTYPKANGQVYGGGERTEQDQMPVEESGNLLLLVAGIVRAEGKPDYAQKHWVTLSKWAEYLKSKGLDPENQLCTDDFGGHLAHNTNLSIKAILAIAAYAQLAEKLGQTVIAKTYRKEAEAMAKQWETMAREGDHYKLTFDKPNTWSQKYNLVWDSLLDLNLFPKDIAKREVAFYLTRQNKYGLPLDSRKEYTKLDWCVWSATLAENPKDFDALITPLVKWMNETPARVPLTDWYETQSGRQVGFQARSVVGGLYLPILKKQWRGR
jgi:hypothetical protein